MSFTDEALKAKLSTLNETQDSIVSVSQWIMFHRRHANRITTFWLTRLKSSTAGKRLNLIYLANEIVQNSRARRKDDFPDAFSPIIAEAAQVAYKDATTDIQQKIRRVVEVWRARQVFDLAVQEAIESRIDEIDRNRSSTKKPLMGGSLFSSGASGSLPTELQPLAPLQVALSKAMLTSTSALSTADADYAKLHDPKTTLPTPPVHAARLSALLKSLANAETSLVETIKSRTALIDNLSKILDENRIALTKDQSEHETILNRQSSTEAKKREVEDGIMRAYSAENSAPASASPGVGDDGGRRSTSLGADNPEPERPEVEALTPPPPASPLTPTLTPTPVLDPGPNPHPEPTEPQEDADVSNLLASMTNAHAPPPTASIPSHNLTSFAPSADPRIQRSNGTVTGSRKRKMSQLGPDEFDLVQGLAGSGMVETGNDILSGQNNDDDVMADLDDDVAELLRQESKKAMV